MRRAICLLVCAAVSLGISDATRGDEADDLEKLRKAITGAIAKIDGAASRDMRAYQKSRDLMYKEVEGLTEKLRPKSGTKTYKSASGDFVLVIAANGASPTESGTNAVANDDEAQLVVAIAGDGGPLSSARIGGAGGAAQAQSARGIAIALAGRGGFGGGGGGGGGAKGKIGSIGFGGPGGAPSGGASQGGDGGGGGISDVSALRNALKPVKEKSAGEKEKSAK